ncbi:MAG: thioesterase family protein [Rhizobiaceae bacterium]|nr:thioesterase family protein [Rhizobiaceae bacterium]
MSGESEAKDLPHSTPSPFVGFRGQVVPDWIDANGHMNVSWYDHVFDRAESALFDAFGVDEKYIRRAFCGMFRLEKRVRYEKELVEGDDLRIDSRIVSSDGRLLKHFHELWNLTREVRAASAHYVSIHVDLTRRKPAQISDPLVLVPLQRLAYEHTQLRPLAERDR